MAPEAKKKNTNSSNNKKKSLKPRQSVTQYRKYVQWQVDSDNLDKLSPEDREWMLKFQEAEYGGNGHFMKLKKKAQRQRWLDQKRQREDAMIFARHLHGVNGSIDSCGRNSPPDVFQPSPEDALIEAIDKEPIVRFTLKKIATKKSK